MALTQSRFSPEDSLERESIAYDLRGLVLAAGRGTRFRGDSGTQVPKVLQPVLGKPIIGYVLDALREAGVSETAIVVGFAADQVRSQLGETYAYAVQPELRGSGHAVGYARAIFEGAEGSVVVMCGDSPLFLPRTIRAMASRHRQTDAAVTLAAARLEDAKGYGRILRDNKGNITRIVEEKCATEEQRAIKEVNGGAYVFDVRWLFDNIDSIAENEAGEYNLTDVVRIAVEQGREVSWVECDAREIGGVNTPEELAAAEAILARRIKR